jgi:hypothetical protein
MAMHKCIAEHVSSCFVTDKRVEGVREGMIHAAVEASLKAKL